MELPEAVRLVQDGDDDGEHEMRDPERGLVSSRIPDPPDGTQNDVISTARDGIMRGRPCVADSTGILRGVWEKNRWSERCNGCF
jgi:hypothetical protein